MDLNETQVFVKVVQAGSFSGAARLMGLPKSTVSAKLASLERRLGVSLLQRTTRRIHPTEAGTELFHVCAKALAEVEAGLALATRAQSAPKGLLRVTAPVDVATNVLPDLLSRFAAKYPEVQLELVLTGRAVDLVAEGIDVAIRAGKLKDSSLLARKIGVSRFAAFATPAFLKGKRIDSPKALEGAPCLRFSPYSKGVWELRSGNRETSVRVGGGPCVDDLTTVKALALAGQGVALLPIYLVRKEVRAGKLEQVLPTWHSRTDDVYLLYPQQRFVQPKVRAFVTEAHDALKDVFTDRC